MTEFMQKEQAEKIYFPHQKEKISLLIEVGEVNWKVENDEILVSGEQIKAYKELEDKIKSDFISYRQFLKTLGLNVRPLKPKQFGLIPIFQSFGVDFEIIHEKLSINQITHFVSKKSAETFYELIDNNYVSYDNALNVLNIPKHQLNKLRELGIPVFIEIGKSIKFYRYDIIEELTNTVEQTNKLKNSSDYYTQKEVQTLLNLSEEMTSECVKLGVLEKVRTNQNLYPKTNVENALKEIESLKESFMTIHQVLEYLNIQHTPDGLISYKKSDLPYLVRTFEKSANHLYKREEVKEYKFSRSGWYLHFAPYSDDAVFFFNSVIENLEFQGELKQLDEKVKHWLIEFSRGVLRNQKNNTERTKNNYISTYLHMLLSLADWLREKNFKRLTSDDINHFMNSQTKTFNIQFYQFLKFVKDNKVLTVFNLTKISNPHHELKEDRDTSVYPFDEFTELYTYTVNTDLHKERAINDSVYASSWLYVLMHLTNAWRHSDVINIPEISPESVGIFDVSWFEEHELSRDKARNIMGQFSQYQLVISKTQMKRNFFWSEGILLPLATAMVITEFHRRADNGISLISFQNKDNRFSEKARVEFFSNSLFWSGNVNYFSSLKMNRTVMTYLFYQIQNLAGEGYSAFELVQKIRNHKSDITKTYIKHDETQLKVSKMLFDRGEFGFLYDKLLEVLNDENKVLSLEARTAELMKIKATFNIPQVEATAGFLNKIEEEKSSLIDQLRRMDIEEAFDYVKKIYVNELPSKEEHVQCFVSKDNCPKKSSGFSCFSCTYAIPNFYSLTALAEYIKKRFKRYKIAETNQQIGEMKKESNLLVQSMELLAQAISVFGEEEVWEFIEGGKVKFEEDINQIELLT